MSTPVDRHGGTTTGTVNPGVIWSGQYFQVGVEAVLPVNEHTGFNPGVVGHLHFLIMLSLPSVAPSKARRLKLASGLPRS
jgi:hypothetical protein